MPSELFDELAEDVKAAEAEIQTADDPAKEVEAKEEISEETEQAEPVEEKEVPRIPLPELQAERKKRQAAEAQLREEQEKYSRLDERLKVINEHIQPKETPPKYEEDPFEYLKQTQEGQNRSVEDLAKRFEDFNQQQEQQRRQAELSQRVVASENVFRQDHADYDDAIHFLRSGRAAEYNAMGISDPVQIEQMLGQEAVQLAQMAVQNGVSPAEMAYNIAKNRGFSSKKEPDRLDQIQKGQERSKSLSSAGGGEKPPLDIEALANMSDDEFAQAMKNGQWGKLLGAT